MPGQMIEFKTNGRTCPGYLAKPPSGTGPGLIVIQEYWGLVDHIKKVADRFAAAGFVALAPDLYHGETAAGPDDAGRRLMALNIPEASKDLRGAAKHLITMAEVKPKKVGALGFCMGGQLALFAACEAPEEIHAAVDFYGIHPHVKPDFAKLQGPVQCHFAKKDAYVAETAARELIATIQSAGKPVEAHFYDADHAFFNDARKEVYDPNAAQVAWDRTVDFLKKHLA